jgi:hypothetical protein
MLKRSSMLSRLKWFLLAGALFAVPVLAADAPFEAPPASSSATVSAPSSSSVSTWLSLVTALAVGLLTWYQRQGTKVTHAKLDAVIADPTTSAPVRTAAQVYEDIEPMLLSAAGHVAHDMDQGDGADLHDLATTAGQDIFAGLSDAAKAEATKYLGAAGGGLVDFFAGVIKHQVAGLQAAKVTAAAAAGAAAAVAAVPKAPAPVAGPKAAAAVDAATDA